MEKTTVRIVAFKTPARSDMPRLIKFRLEHLTNTGWAHANPAEFETYGMAKSFIARRPTLQHDPGDDVKAVT